MTITIPAWLIPHGAEWTWLGIGFVLGFVVMWRLVCWAIGDGFGGWR